MAGDQCRAEHARRRPHRFGQDPRCLPLGARPLREHHIQSDRGTTILYISPLKALAVDVERNLRAPLAGIRQRLRADGLTPPDISVAIRTGDTPASERQRQLRRPSTLLITTPESLYLMLTSKARETLQSVTTVIVDEVHAVAGTKRGAHLALSLERLDALLPRRRSASGSRRPFVPPRRSPRSSAGPTRSPSSSHRATKSSTCPSSCRSRTSTRSGTR